MLLLLVSINTPIHKSYQANEILNLEVLNNV